MESDRGEMFWDERYRSQHRIWSGRPGEVLVELTSDLPAGRALDAGCGEGADAVWLAGRGWRVTGVDLSSVALARAAEEAAALGGGIAERIEWVHADLTSWSPAESAYDLVSAQFLQLPASVRDGVLRRLATALAPGGILLVVGHHPSDLHTTVRRPPLPELFYTADDVAALLDPAGFDVLVSQARPRPATDPEGRTVTVRDTVLLARRRS